jgi:hypothetical protein
MGILNNASQDGHPNSQRLRSLGLLGYEWGSKGNNDGLAVLMTCSRSCFLDCVLSAVASFLSTIPNVVPVGPHERDKARKIYNVVCKHMQCDRG